jgi:hypothetical protein
MKLVACMMIAMVLFASNPAFGFGIRGFVIANGGMSATPASNGVYQLYGTAGQPGVGISQNASRTLCSGFWCFGGPQVLAVDPRSGPSLPTRFALGPATPNPSRGQARFHLALPKTARVTLSVYDVSGRQVGDEVSQQLDAGEHELFWRAPRAQTGIYFMRLATDGLLMAKRTIVLVR